MWSHENCFYFSSILFQCIHEYFQCRQIFNIFERHSNEHEKLLHFSLCIFYLVLFMHCNRFFHEKYITFLLEHLQNNCKTLKQWRIFVIIYWMEFNSINLVLILEFNTQSVSWARSDDLRWIRCGKQTVTEPNRHWNSHPFYKDELAVPIRFMLSVMLYY